MYGRYLYFVCPWTLNFNILNLYGFGPMKTFNRVITFHIQGEIYNEHITPENIIKHYNWTFKHCSDGTIIVKGKHKDDHGRITKMIKLPRVHKYKTSDTEFFLSTSNKKKN
jgi:hypothetical protein